jgi:hypothetical protein
MQPLSLVERRSRVEAAREALTEITQVLYQCSGPELAEVLGVVDAWWPKGLRRGSRSPRRRWVVVRSRRPG